MSATQVSFAEFAIACIEPAPAIGSTPPAESMPGPSLDAGLVAHASVGGGECPELLPPYVPASDLLWRYLTDGYDWSYIANLPDGHSDRPTLIARAEAAWARIREEVGC